MLLMASLSRLKTDGPLELRRTYLNSISMAYYQYGGVDETLYWRYQLDERGHCQCPVLRMYVCPLCSATGDAAHTLKYCPRNTVTHGDPISAGLPPSKVTSWREVANRMIGRYNANY